MKGSIFITGTDTGVGKTIITGMLGRLLSERGVRVITQKWVQTGCTGFPEDIALHTEFMGKNPDDIEKYLPDVAPYVLEFPSSPHLAALLEKKQINASRIEDSFRRLEKDFEFIAVEGTGGLMVPVNDDIMIVDIIKRLDLSVLIVAGNRLGAINQTVLTVEALQERSIDIAGIVFNRFSSDENDIVLEDNPRIVESLTGVSVLGDLPYSRDLKELYQPFKPIGERILAGVARQ